MTQTPETRQISPLMAVQLLGVATPDRVATALGFSPDEAARTLAVLTDADLAEDRRVGALAGVGITPRGRDALNDALEAEGLRGDAGLSSLYRRFETIDGEIKAVCTAWQVRRHGTIEQPNDHSDPDYDHEVIERLAALHDRVRALGERVASICPRHRRYLERLDDCLERARGGDRSAVTSALKESYHTVWFEWHEDFMLTLGRARAE